MQHSHQNAAGSLESILLTALLAFAAFVYLGGWRRLRSQSVSASGARGFSFIIGLFLIWAATVSPLAGLDHELLTVHMLKHLLLMTVAPPLIWLGEPLRVLSRTLRANSLQIFRRPLLRSFASVLARPQVGWLSATAALVLWHIPPIFALGMQSPAWHFVEQSTFLVSGLLFWWPVIQPWPSASVPDLSMILYLFFATLPCDILSGFLVFCDRVIYPAYLSSSHIFGFSTLGDQQCAAAFMWTTVTVVYLVAGVALTQRLLSPQHFHTESAEAKIDHRQLSLETLQHGD